MVGLFEDFNFNEGQIVAKSHTHTPTHTSNANLNSGIVFDLGAEGQILENFVLVNSFFDVKVRMGSWDFRVAKSA